MDYSDPWDWTVDDVVHNICYSDDIWSSRPNAQRPEATSFENTLRENSVDGATLLELDSAALKNDLGVTALGQRSAITYAVDVLRHQSSKYLSHRAVQNQIEERARIFSPAPTPPHTFLSEKDRSETPSSVILPPHLPSALSLPLAGTLSNTTDSGIASNEPRARAGEVIIQDGAQKRRKLLVLDTAAPSMTRRTLGSKVKNERTGYLPADKLPINDLFFGDQNFPVDDDRNNDDGDDFAIMQNPHAPGEQNFVNRRMRHFLQAVSVQESESMVVRKLYPIRLARTENSCHVIAFTKHNSKVESSRRYATKLDRIVADDITNTTEDGEEYDYLVEKYPTRPESDDVLPAYGDSDDESLAESYADELEVEEAEREAKSNNSANMSQDAVEDVINAAVKELEEKWQTHKQPKMQPFKIWNEAKGRRRLERLYQARDWVAKLSDRLEALRKEICKDEWRDANKIREMCAVLEPSVFDKLETQFKIQVWERNVAPPRPIRLPQPSRPSKLRNINVDEESLTSDSEAVISDDLNDFVEIDDEQSDDDKRDKTELVRQAVPQETNISSSTADSGTSAVNQDLDMSDAPHQLDDSSPSSPTSPSNEGSRSRAASMDSVLGLMSGIKVKSETRKRPRESFSEMEIVDLTGSSPPRHEENEDYRIITPSPEPYEPGLGNHPERATATEIENWDYDYLAETSDRGRIIMKLMQPLDPKFYRQIMRLFLNRNGKSDLKKKVSAIFHNYHKIDKLFTNGTLTQKDLAKYRAVANLYLCWIPASQKSWFDPGLITSDVLEKAAKMVDFDNFYDFVVKTNQTDEQDEEDDPDTPRKRRKKQVIHDKNATTLRKSAHERRAAVQERTMQFKLQVESSGLSEMEQGGIVINPGKGEDEDYIHINRYIATKLKPHQIDGIRFMWREIVTEQGEARQGCLLAHTMGLGKTVQTIALLATIAEAGTSEDPRIVNQIPEPLRGSRTLVLCPASLIENWKQELIKWTPPELKNILYPSDITNSKVLTEQLQLIEIWHEEGGILLLSYDRFRQLIQNKKKKKTETRPLTEAEHDTVMKHLLESPRIVVADEAHKLKNQETGVGISAKQFKTGSRIALTGSPLANNLQDYYAMIDWVAPSYLGDVEEFRDTYRTPIEEGTYADSSPYAQRRSMKKLRVLESEIGPKVNRADISVVSNDLKKKTEFVLKLPLTQVQQRLYSSFVQSIIHHTDKKTAQMKLMDWMSVLSLLCDHPSCFRAKLQERREKKTANEAAAKAKAKGAEASADLLDDVDASSLGLSATMLDMQEDLFKELTQGMDPESSVISHKMAVLEQIIVNSKKVGDKVLIFSHCLPVLSYLERFFSTLDPRVSLVRLDGSVAMKERDRMVKQFNEGRYDVFLISTRAGSLGLNIVGANRVVLLDFSWNPSWEEQAVGRAYRLGQTKPVYVYHLVTGGTFEEKLHHVTVFKRQLAARVVDKKAPQRSALKSDEMLFEPREVEAEDLEHVKGMDEVFDQVLASEAGKSIRDVRTSETLHAESDEKLTEEEEREVQQEIKVTRLRTTNPEEYSRMKKQELAAKQAEQTRLLQISMQNQMLRPGYQVPTAAAPPIVSMYASTQPMQPVQSIGAISPAFGMPTQIAATQSVTTPVLQQPADRATQMVQDVTAPPSTTQPNNVRPAPPASGLLSGLQGLLGFRPS